jgi:hypothetical protein
MKTSLFAGATLTALLSGHALANEPLTLVLDWYINPDHAPIMVAEQIGAFKARVWTSRLSRRRIRRCRRVWWPPVRRTGHHLPAAGALFR